ncbi:MAG: hypothetical protein JSW53_00800 [Candidatus Bathyarchaeota archaeon]|nr:MAG: hypothetical protein JSW53_00800 [Candidatus Bathyarchaeota archaeon]UCE43482.1 MAG: hypothetical protein JSV57_03710 [Candidatus Bathyarchaeota archaeon]
MIEERKKSRKEEAEEVKEILGVVSQEVPALIKGIVGAVFSEEAGKDMGRAAAAFYRELKEGGMPEETAVRMTENYVGVFTSLGNVLKGAVGKGKIGELAKEDIEEEVAKRVRLKIAEKTGERTEES